METRGIILGSYSTVAKGWTLTSWNLSPARRKEYLVDKPGGSGHWDLSTVLTDGEPVYEARTLTVTLECSEGDRLSREAEIDNMVNQLEGYTVEIFLPDQGEVLRYLKGVVHVERLYNDPVHASVTVTAVCDPWKYAYYETVINLTATTKEKSEAIILNGRMPVVPVLWVHDGARINLVVDGESWALSAGEYKIPNLRMTPNSGKLIKYSGSGSFDISYREAVL